MKDPIINPHDGSIIEPSNTWLYLKVVKAKGKPEEKVLWRPYKLEDRSHLETLKLSLLGDEHSRLTTVWQNTYIRFGWLDRELNSLNWVSLEYLIYTYHNKTMTKTNRAKLNHICRLLFISIKDIKA